MADATPTPFEQAVAYISSSTTPTSSETKLKIYALYKISTSSITPPTSRPGIFDFTGRAKWDAWSNLGRSASFDGVGEEVAKQKAREEYIEVAKEMGWSDEGVKEDVTDDVPKKKVAGTGGMVAVSSMLAEEEDDDAPPSKIHDLALSGRAQDLATYLREEGTGVDVNAKDSYGFAPIHLATDRGHLSIVKVLVEFGANRELADEDGNTPLALAEMAGHDDIVAFLKA